MQTILQPNKKIPISLKIVIAFVLIIAGIAFYFSLKFAGQNQKAVANLILDENISSPGCSSIGGFYTQPFEITLTTSDNNCKIYYSLDGTEPTLNSSLYSHPILIQNRTNQNNEFSNIPTSPRWKPPVGEVFKATVLRALAVTESNNRSEELTATFFINDLNNKKYTLPVIELTVNPDDLFGYKNGIYVLGKNYDDKKDYLKKDIPLDLPWWSYPSNYLKRGNNAERLGNIEYYSTQGDLVFQKNVGIRINGNATRGFAQKALRINFKDEPLKLKLFEDSKTEIFNTIILRNSGNDWDKTLFRDAFMQSLLQNTNIDRQSSSPAIVFINGEYWGIHFVYERFDENYLSNKYGLSTDSIVIAEHINNLSYGKKKDLENIKSLLSFIKLNDLSVQKNYEYVSKQIDVANFIESVIANIYYANSDWPQNNVKFWRYRTKQNSIDSLGAIDGRWRWMLYDTDWGFGYTGTNAYEINMLEKTKTTGSVGILFSGLLQNKTFERQFLFTFQTYLNSYFAPGIVIKKINEYEKLLNLEMSEHINRWRVIGSFNKWKQFVDDLRTFAIKRPAIQANQLNEFFKLSGENKITAK